MPTYCTSNYKNQKSHKTIKKQNDDDEEEERSDGEEELDGDVNEDIIEEPLKKRAQIDPTKKNNRNIESSNFV
jgi:hypothetical protein